MMNMVLYILLIACSKGVVLNHARTEQPYKCVQVPLPIRFPNLIFVLTKHIKCHYIHNSGSKPGINLCNCKVV